MKLRYALQQMGLMFKQPGGGSVYTLETLDLMHQFDLMFTFDSDYSAYCALTYYDKVHANAYPPHV